MKYWIEVTLTTEDVVEANSPEEAFEILSARAINSDDWGYIWEEVDEEEE